ncbi:MAG: hypothetical protein AUI14_04835 [Actinobacteria bacterium 13_2_20CM_2_71_6]|nr:MAG: hypothetical protein AUI14_04835 [Actinobacteria bacterium 13_2_20CM_2_71_6]
MRSRDLPGDPITTSPKNLARIAGILYLLLVGAAFNEGFVLSRIVKSGNAQATADNIRSSATLFRLGFLGDLTAATFWLLTAMALYLLLKHVNQLAAAAMVTFAAVGAAIMTLNQLNQYTALTVATGDDYTRAFGRAGSDVLTLVFADMQHNGYLIDEMFFGLWLLPLGYLVIRSGYFPKVLGVLLTVACFGYLAALFTVVLAPDLGTSVTLFVTVPAAAAGELTFMLWLLIKGVRVPDLTGQHA